MSEQKPSLEFEGIVRRLVSIKAKMNGAKYREILDENVLQNAQDLRLG